ncbi:MAG: HAMP domain-containing sensor histidine kinase [Methylocystis sp.]
MRNSIDVLPTIVLEWLEMLAPKGAAKDPVEDARQKLFIAARFAAGFSALVSAPMWLFIFGVPSIQHVAQFILALTPLASIAVLKSTGDFRLAQNISICGWLALAISVGASTLGHEAIMISLLIIAMIEGALTMQVSVVIGIVSIAFGLLFFEVSLPSSLAATATDRVALACAVAPLLLYMAALSVGAIFVEHARARWDRRNARDLRLLSDALGDIVVHFDRTGAVSSIIGDTHRTYGLETRDLLARGFFQRVHVADRPAFLKLVSDAISTSAPSNAVLRLQVGGAVNLEGGYVEPVFNYFDARICHVETGRREAYDPSAPVVCILRDVTAAHQAEEEIAAARREAELAMAGKTRFLANVSHELRTPLNAIIGFSEMLGNVELEPQEPEKRREYARIISDSGHHLHEVVNSILDMSKIESGLMQIFPEPFAMPDLVEQCCDMIQLKADQGMITLTRDYPEDLEELVADKRACKQILINLLSNAVKFTPPNGNVTVRVWPEGNSLNLSVSDNGIGIAPNDLAHLGEAFFQASSSHDRAYEGTGLGLSVVRGLVGLHGGAIAVESALKAGTTVTVRFPLDGRGHPDYANASTKIEAIARHGLATPGQDISHEQEMVKKIA